MTLGPWLLIKAPIRKIGLQEDLGGRRICGPKCSPKTAMVSCFHRQEVFVWLTDDGENVLMENVMLANFMSPEKSQTWWSSLYIHFHFRPLVNSGDV